MPDKGKALGNGKTIREQYLEDLKVKSRAMAMEYSEDLNELNDPEINKHRKGKGRRKTDK